MHIAFCKVRFAYKEVRYNYRRNAVYIHYRDDDGRVRAMTKTCRKSEDPEEQEAFRTQAAEELHTHYVHNHCGEDVRPDEEVHAEISED